MSPPADMAAAGVATPSTPVPAAEAQSGYQPRRPEHTVLYQVVSQHMETLFAEAEAASPHGSGYPPYVRREFERYLRCGIFSCGFSRLR